MAIIGSTIGVIIAASFMVAPALKDALGVPGIFAAVPYCIDLIGGPYLETRPEVCKAFRPKSALRPPAA